jgi:hypothetical protein
MASLLKKHPEIIPTLIEWKSRNVSMEDVEEAINNILTPTPNPKASAQQEITFKGYSDDNIAFDGGGFCDEFGNYNTSEQNPELLLLSDGAEIKVWYDEGGVWRIKLNSELPEGALCTCAPCEIPDDDNYSDVLKYTPASPLTWIADIT